MPLSYNNSIVVTMTDDGVAVMMENAIGCNTAAQWCFAQQHAPLVQTPMALFYLPPK